MAAIATSYMTSMLQKLFGATNYTPTATWYAALFASGTELTTGAYSTYARIAYADNTTNWPVAYPIVNGTDIFWPQTPGTGTPGTVTSVRFYDALTAGNEICRTAEFAGVVLGVNSIPKMLAGQITISGS
jgi:hypothetical protein